MHWATSAEHRGSMFVVVETLKGMSRPPTDQPVTRSPWKMTYPFVKANPAMEINNSQLRVGTGRTTASTRVEAFTGIGTAHTQSNVNPACLVPASIPAQLLSRSVPNICCHRAGCLEPTQPRGYRGLHVTTGCCSRRSLALRSCE